MNISTFSVWDTAYGQASLKLERAQKHIDEFGERILASSNCYGPTLNMDGKTGEQFLYYSPGDYMLRGELSAIAGDAIHNLRSAIDIAWLEIVREVGKPVAGFTKFPINPDQPKKWLERVLTETAGIDPTSRIYDFLVNHVKGYKGGDSDILSIHALDIDDKHRFLIPTLYVTGIEGIELEDEDGRIDVLNIVLLTHREFYRKTVPLGGKLKNHGQIQFYITFGEGNVAQGLEVIPTLERWHAKVGELIRWLWRIK